MRLPLNQERLVKINFRANRERQRRTANRGLRFAVFSENLVLKVSNAPVQLNSSHSMHVHWKTPLSLKYPQFPLIFWKIQAWLLSKLWFLWMKILERTWTAIRHLVCLTASAFLALELQMKKLSRKATLPVLDLRELLVKVCLKEAR